MTVLASALLASGFASQGEPLPFEAPLSSVALALHLGVLAVGVVFLIASVRGPRAPWPGPREPAQWNAGDILLAGLGYLGGGMLLASFIGGRELAFPLLLLAGTVPLALACVVGIARIYSAGQDPWSAFGLRWLAAPRGARVGTRALLAALQIVYGLHMLVPWLYRALGQPWGPPRPNAAALQFLETASAWDLAAVCGFALLFAPVFEELLFRGLLYGVLRKRIGVRGAIAVTAALFAIVHPPIDWAPIAALGVALAIAYEKSGTLLAPMAAHFLHNAYALVQLALARAALDASGG